MFLKNIYKLDRFIFALGKILYKRQKQYELMDKCYLSVSTLFFYWIFSLYTFQMFSYFQVSPLKTPYPLPSPMPV